MNSNIHNSPLTKTQIICTKIHSWIRSQGYTPQILNELYDINVYDIVITFYEIILIENLRKVQTSFFWEYTDNWFDHYCNGNTNEYTIEDFHLFYILIFIICDCDEYVINEDHKNILNIIKLALDQYLNIPNYQDFLNIVN